MILFGQSNYLIASPLEISALPSFLPVITATPTCTSLSPCQQQIVVHTCHSCFKGEPSQLDDLLLNVLILRWYLDLVCDTLPIGELGQRVVTIQGVVYQLEISGCRVRHEA
jgi:hypothetical protein